MAHKVRGLEQEEERHLTQLASIAVARLISTQRKTKVRRLLKRRSNIKMERSLSDNISKENSWVRVVLPSVMNLSSVKRNN